MIRTGPAAAGLIVTAFVAGALLARHLAPNQAQTPRLRSPAAQVLVLLNERRKRDGLQPLRRDLTLAAIARAHNRSMLSSNMFTHDTPQLFARRVAYLHRRLIGEVQAWGTSGWATPKGFVSLWMASPAHRRVLLTPGMRRIGISVLGGPFQGQSAARVATAEVSS